ncbi:SEFIR domain-containing protein [Actinokineospora pegani]|uniref:SEFIR domain-containing protein n=1 Tax=Actinokineospora pegani TaxID=2654637 RepID=UPI0018D4BBBC|nr:SEFIR domain-containing protein [Actinokineospora pegani]
MPAPKVFYSYSHDDRHHSARVRGLAAHLEREGAEGWLDQWKDHHRTDWSWHADLMREADFIIAVGSPQYRRRVDRTAPPTEGLGAQHEGQILRDLITEDQAAALRKILPVVLPGGTIDHLPRLLNPYSTTRFDIPEISPSGLAPLIRAMTGVSVHQPPPRGVWLRDTAPTGLPRVAEEHGPVLVAEEERWLEHNSHAHAGRTRIAGVEYPDSIIVRPRGPLRAPAFVEVAVTRDRFTAVAGVPDDATEAFQVGRFRVLVDGAVRWEGRAGHGGPTHIDLRVRGAKRIRLEAERPPALPGATATRPPELAWGDPTQV